MKAKQIDKQENRLRYGIRTTKGDNEQDKIQ